MRVKLKNNTKNNAKNLGKNLGKRQKSYKFGTIAEKLIAFWLKIGFYHIIAMRYRNHFGEIDLIATKGKKIFFIEVKARKNLDQNFNFIEHKQANRLRKTAQYFLDRNPKYYHFDCFSNLFVVNKFFFFKKYSNFW